MESLAARLKSAGGRTDEEVEAAVKAAEGGIKAAKKADFYEMVIVNRDEAEVSQALEEHIYSDVQEVIMVNGGPA